MLPYVDTTKFHTEMLKLKRLSLHLRTFVLLVSSLAVGGVGYSCNYGQNCAFEPAPPGRAPACALPGLTYCIHPDPYPELIIRQLVEIGSYDIRTLLSDESRDEFNSHRKPDYPYGYGPNSLPHVDQISLVDDSFYKPNFNTKFHSFSQDNIFAQKTPLQPPSPVEGPPYNYQAANFSKFSGFHGFQTAWTPQQSLNQYDRKYFRQNAINSNFGVYNQNFYTPTFNPNHDAMNWFGQASSVTQYNPAEWWKYINPSRSDGPMERSYAFPARSGRRNGTSARGRKKRNAELVRAAAQRKLTGEEALRIALGLASAETSAERPRRQTGGQTQQLCSVRAQYITPRAALNNRGSWKYVVNMAQNMTQLVRAEICTSTQCSGLCSLPQGYSSRCEQKYVQKRLVALESNGQNLYTDIFWIPSCCQCTIVANN